MALKYQDTVQINEHFLPFLINCDSDNLPKADRDAVNEWLENLPQNSDFAYETETAFARCEITGQMANCVELSIYVPVRPIEKIETTAKNKPYEVNVNQLCIYRTDYQKNYEGQSKLKYGAVLRLDNLYPYGRNRATPARLLQEVADVLNDAHQQGRTIDFY